MILPVRPDEGDHGRTEPYERGRVPILAEAPTVVAASVLLDKSELVRHMRIIHGFKHALWESTMLSKMTFIALSMLSATKLKKSEDKTSNLEKSKKSAASREVEEFEFRPLTEEEKKTFVNSLDAKSRQILDELSGKAECTSSPDYLYNVTLLVSQAGD
jgi:hypothetical protein